MDIIAAFELGSVTVLVRPNSKKTEVLNFDESRNAWRVNVSAPAQDNEANIEVIKFFSRLIKKPVRIVRGLTSRTKVLSVR